MYKTVQYHKLSFEDYAARCGLQLDPLNPWILLGDRIPWSEIEEEYAKIFTSHTGHPAKPLGMALGALIIQNREMCSDRELVDKITGDPYLQYFIGRDVFLDKCPFTSPALVSFRKRLNAEFLMRINEICLAAGACTGEAGEKDRSRDVGTEILAIACPPAKRDIPEDYILLNKARRKLEDIIDYFHKKYEPWPKPRTYRRNAGEEFLALDKNKKRTEREIRAFIRTHLGYIQRDLGYIDRYLEEGLVLPVRYEVSLDTIRELYRQQKYMYSNKVHDVENRIVDISQPIRAGREEDADGPGCYYIVRTDAGGHFHMEVKTPAPVNRGEILPMVLEDYLEKKGAYPKEVDADSAFRTEENEAYCREHGILLKAMQENGGSDETAGEIACRAGLAASSLQKTVLDSIALTVLVSNLFSLPAGDLDMLVLEDTGAVNGRFYPIGIPE